MEDLISLIGEEAVQKLSAAFGGTKVYIPTTKDIESRNAKARAEFDALLRSGSTAMNAYRSLSDELGLSIRQVQNIVNHPTTRTA